MIIAQISDLHIKSGGALAYDAADTLTALNRAVDYINRTIPSVSLVLVSGDIADDGRLGSYKTAANSLSRLIPPFFMVPGNHDNKKNLAKAFPGHTYLCQAFEDSGDRHMCYDLNKFFFAPIPLRILALDTVDEGNHGGGVDQNRLDWLDQMLSSEKERPVFIFMHHPPFPSGIGHMDKEPFVNRDQLAGLMTRHQKICRMACGHIHRSIFTEFAKTPACCCPGTGMQLVLDLTSQAPSCFIMEPQAVMFHGFFPGWGDKDHFLTHVGLVTDHPGQYGPNHSF